MVMVGWYHDVMQFRRFFYRKPRNLVLGIYPHEFPWVHDTEIDGSLRSARLLVASKLYGSLCRNVLCSPLFTFSHDGQEMLHGNLKGHGQAEGLPAMCPGSDAGRISSRISSRISGISS